MIDLTKIQMNVGGSVYEWSAKHATIAHEGAVLANGTVIPPRRWTEQTLKDFGFEVRMAAIYQSNGGDLSQAFIQASREFNDALKGAIVAPIYQYPRQTERSNGQVVGSPRNIVDEGELLRSQSMRIV